MSWQDSVIAALSTVAPDGGYVVTRQTNAGYDAATGDPVLGGTTTFTLTDATVQPYKGRGLADLLVEGRHTTDAVEIMTTTELYVSDTGFVADLINYLGGTYEVMRVDGPLRLAGGTHYEVYAARVVAP